VAAEAGGEAARRVFGLFWVGESVRQLGTATSTVAMPLIAVTLLHASAFATGVLQSAEWLPWLVLGLPAGAWVDRLPRKRVMVACDVVSMPLLAGAPIAAWCGVLTMGWLVASGLFLGVASVFFLTAQQVFLPATVPLREDLPRANSKVEGSEAAARVAGPGLAGVLAQVLGAATVLLLDAVGSVVSAVCLVSIRVADPAVAPRSGLLREIRDGLATVTTDPFLRPLAAYSTATNLIFGALQAILVVFLVRSVGADAATVGALIGIAGIGGVAGALFAGGIGRKLGTARAILVLEAATVPFGLLIPLTFPGTGLALFVVGLLVSDIGATVSNVMIGSFRQGYLPRELLGRVTASSRWLSYGAVAAGGVLGGALATAVGPRAGLWVLTIAQVLCVGILFSGPLKRHRDLPAHNRRAEPVNP
jgi:MFS family permease